MAEGPPPQRAGTPLPAAGRRPSLLRSPLYLRMVARVALVLLIPAAITSIYNIQRSSSARIESSQPQLLQATEAKATAVEAILLRSINNVLLLGQAPPLQRYANALATTPAPPSRDVEDLFHGFLRRSGGLFDGISVLDRTGQEQLTVSLEGRSTRLKPGSSEKNEALLSGAMGLTSISGQLAPVFVSPIELATTPDGRPLSPPRPFIRYASPLFALDGSVAGVLVVSAPLTPLLQPLTPNETSDHVYLVDASGDYLSGPEPQRLHGGQRGTGITLRTERPEDAGEILGRPRGTLLDTPNRPGFLQAFARIRPAGHASIQWTVVTERPLSAILASERAIGLVILATTLGSLLLALLVTLLFARGIVIPIHQLATAAGAISQGRWETPLPSLDRHDELGELTDAFTRMGRQLQSAWRDLQQHVDDLQRSEAELRSSRNLLQALIDHSTAVIYVKSVKGPYLFVNRQFASLTKHSPEDMVGKTDDEILSPEWAARRKAEDQQALDAAGPVTHEQEIPLSDGIHTYLSVRFPLLDTHGEAYAVASVATDITDRKRAEEVLRRAHDELEQRVQERTQELREAHLQLVESARVAGREEIATTVLHNVGNVISSVKVSASIMESRLRQSRIQPLTRATSLLMEHQEDLVRYLTEDPKGKLLPRYLSAATEALVEENTNLLKEMEGLQNNLDHVTNIIAVQQSLASRTMQILEDVDVCATADDALRIQLRQSLDIEVLRDYTELPRLHTDRHKLLQILVNLISNAKHALMASQSPRRRLEVHIRDIGEYVQLQVSDNGIGIPAENMLRIFQYGFTAKKDGHGFGLHSCALHARSMGGCLRAHSDGLGRGATFTLELPWNPKSEEP
ncbi:PAS domain-containing protein [Archangium violaceum]|uniref:ATP-binding protein n=1 Tax=Archangium violaceum TaxID=83451 RepID=UPI0019501BC9|nr:ATP-binding protein [Archangium violaceum]QRN95232.1 PAS domain-containing protein [Archangium violaceum]